MPRRRLADELASLASPAPDAWDPDAMDDLDGTRAALRRVDDDEEAAPLPRSALRRQTDEIALTEGAYRGRRVARRALADSDDSDGLADAGAVEAAWAPESDSGSEEEEEEESEESEEESDDDDGVRAQMRLLAREDDSLAVDRQAERVDELLRSRHVRNQKAVWGHVLEVRIRLQKLLNAANKLPEGAAAAGSQGECAPVRELLGSLLGLQGELSRKRRRRAADAVDVDVDVAGGAPLDEVWRALQADWAAGAERRAEVIETWQAKTRTGQQKRRFKVLNQGVLQQVALVVADERVVANKAHPGGDTAQYDDSTFYQQLLRELVESGGAAGKRDLPQQASRIKLKRTKKACDPKASKGRRLRYEPHPKLQNFTYPVPMADPPMDIGELYRSLFR